MLHNMADPIPLKTHFIFPSSTMVAIFLTRGVTKTFDTPEDVRAYLTNTDWESDTLCLLTYTAERVKSDDNYTWLNHAVVIPPPILGMLLNYWSHAREKPRPALYRVSHLPYTRLRPYLKDPRF